jgi:hypothetical protein
VTVTRVEPAAEDAEEPPIPVQIEFANRDSRRVLVVDPQEFPHLGCSKEFDTGDMYIPIPGPTHLRAIPPGESGVVGRFISWDVKSQTAAWAAVGVFWLGCSAILGAVIAASCTNDVTVIVR